MDAHMTQIERRLDCEAGAAVNPRVVYASISGFGTGAGAGFPGYDLMVQAMSGLMSMTGEPDGPPYRAASRFPM